MTDNIWGLAGLGFVAYLIYKYVSKKPTRAKFTVLQGGLATFSGLGGGTETPQYQPAGSPEPQVEGGTPRIAVLAWAGADCCKC